MVGAAAQRAQATTPVSSSNSTAASTVASSGNSGIGQHVLGASPVALGQSLAGTVVGSVAPNSQPGLTQVPRSTLAPSHAIQPGLVSQRLVLTSQAQARLPSKWPALPLCLSISPPPLALQYWLLFTEAFTRGTADMCSLRNSG